MTEVITLIITRDEITFPFLNLNRGKLGNDK